MKNYHGDGFFLVEIMIALSVLCCLASTLALVHSTVIGQHRDALMRITAINTAVDFLETQSSKSGVNGHTITPQGIEISWHEQPMQVHTVCDADYALPSEGLTQRIVTVSWRSYAGAVHKATYILVMPQQSYNRHEVV